MKVTIFAPAKAHPFGNMKLKDVRRRLAGIEDDTDFVEYMSDGLRESLGVSGEAYMSFLVTPSNRLLVKVDYEVNRKLTAQEEEQLVEYTQGQWSDGIGESFEQHPVLGDYRDGVAISPWFRGQRVSVAYGE